MATLATVRNLWSTDDGNSVTAGNLPAISFQCGTLLPQRVSYTISADTEQTLTIPTGCKSVKINPGQAEELKLRASSGGATVIAFTPSANPTGETISFPIDAATTTAIYLYNDDATSRTIVVDYL